jgi:hypothetical protein
MTVIIGSNNFFGVPFPLVLADRFFNIFEGSDGFSLNIFRWDESTREPVFEVLNGEPLNEHISTNPTGIVTFASPERGVFLYKFRPKPGVSQIFGTVPVDRELTVHITDRSIRVLNGDEQVCALERNQFSGLAIGIQVNADGSIAIGSNGLPEGMVLKRSTETT